jgi:putative flippase GtrA
MQIARFLRFALVGLGTALLYVLAYVLLLRLGVAQFAANALAFALAIAAQYLGQASYTFEARVADTAQICRFAAMVGLGFVTSVAVTGLIGPAFALGPTLSAVIVALVLPVQNFILMTLWVFTTQNRRTENIS